MSKKILEVQGDATRDMRQSGSGSFYSAHNQEVIEKWLSHKDADSDDYYFDEVFGTDEWWDEESHGQLEDFDVSFKETEDEHEDECEYDEEIQKFIDEEPKREMEKVTYQFNDLMGNVQGMKDTALQLLNDFKKVVKTDDFENLPEDEKKLYQTLNDMTQLTLQFPKPEVKKETYDPF